MMIFFKGLILQKKDPKFLKIFHYLFFLNFEIKSIFVFLVKLLTTLLYNSSLKLFRKYLHLKFYTI